MDRTEKLLEERKELCQSLVECELAKMRYIQAIKDIDEEIVSLKKQDEQHG